MLNNRWIMLLIKNAQLALYDRLLLLADRYVLLLMKSFISHFNVPVIKIEQDDKPYTYKIRF
jgi:hypothetical protein